MASVLSYPCLEICRVIFSRSIRQASLMSSDDDHFHNLFYQFCTSKGIQHNVANSITGVFVALFFAGLPGAIFSLESVDYRSSDWIFVFSFFVVAYFGIFSLLAKGSKQNCIPT